MDQIFKILNNMIHMYKYFQTFDIYDFAINNRVCNVNNHLNKDQLFHQIYWLTQKKDKVVIPYNRRKVAQFLLLLLLSFSLFCLHTLRDERVSKLNSLYKLPLVCC